MRGGRLLGILVPALGALAGAVLGGAALGLWGAALAAAAGAAAGAAAVLAGRDESPALRRQSPGLPEGSASAEVLPAGYGRLLLERLPLGILLVDRRGRVRFINDAAVRLLGRRPPGEFHVAALRAPRLLEAVEAALATGRGARAEFALARTGSTDLGAAVEPLGEAAAEETAPALVVMVEDRGEPRRAAERHRDFVANASHELKTPLASISGIIETLTGHARDDPKATERFLGLMGAEVARMKRLVEDLLSLNRIELNERIRPEAPQGIRRIAWEAAEALRPLAAAEDVTLEADPPEDLPQVAGDDRELMQLFSNLIDNAIRYGGAGGRVEVRARGGGPGEPRTGIAVIDHGPGIAREHLPRLTERFYRVSASHSRARGGTGLGLAIVKHFVNRHGGELRIESAPGEGATFTVWLPVLPERAET